MTHSSRVAAHAARQLRRAVDVASLVPKWLRAEHCLKARELGAIACIQTVEARLLTSGDRTHVLRHGLANLGMQADLSAPVAMCYVWQHASETPGSRTRTA